MCLETFAIWSLVYSHQNCCMLFPIKQVRFVVILDLLELAAEIVILALYQIEYFPVIVICNAISLVLRIIGHFNMLIFRNRSWTRESLPSMRLAALGVQIVGFVFQIVKQWYDITYNYEDISIKNCVFCKDKLACDAEFQTGYSFGNFEKILFQRTDKGYATVEEFAHRGITGKNCLIY